MRGCLRQKSTSASTKPLSTGPVKAAEALADRYFLTQKHSLASTPEKKHWCFFALADKYKVLNTHYRVSSFEHCKNPGGGKDNGVPREKNTGL